MADIDYLLLHANTLLADPLKREDVIGVYAGLRPLLAGESDSTSKLSREHAVASPVRGLVTIAGGKYTTYRVMAKDAVDAAVRDVDKKVPASCTEDVPCWVPTATTRCGTRGPCWSRKPACVTSRLSTCSTATARCCPSCWT